MGKPSAPRAFDVGELTKAVEHLAFEMQHFRCYSKLHGNDDLARLCPAARQAVMYALLLHLRLLIDFFYKDATQDDCTVDHFNILDGFQAKFPASIHTNDANVKKMSTDLNKLLAHVTAARWEKPRPPMNEYDKFNPTIDNLIAPCEMALPEGIRLVFLSHYTKWESAHQPIVRRPAPSTVSAHGKKSVAARSIKWLGVSLSIAIGALFLCHSSDGL
jgi:hypothetical protein